MTARPLPSALSRRSLLLGGLAAVGAGTLAACGSSSDTPAAAGGSASGGTGFPVTIEHKYGSTTVEQAPKRVLSLGYTDHEVLLALGIVPVGVIQWIPEWKQGVSTWSVPKPGRRHAGAVRVRAWTSTRRRRCGPTSS
ncbi:hypothetical protein GCM10025868_15720 [Angustibacter aerolatus]|uniref:Fe/B12 periplasmic-binding domain-containing protein n=1 Tax=Angustibacter aerolatus TaxID=1162965 RepID=A0ABQ6JDQ7_9ACTN|nr:hypothetical protein [Angustibacter aerolatus]GMA86322.1 hypothetical protein GCM10025868_15720 [Angustibacter aerolatus]